MKKLLSITPHLSTGGAPQVLVKRLELIKDNFDIYVIEYSNYSNTYVVQKNKLKKLINPENFFTLYDNKNEIIDIISKIKPDIIHFEEIPEMFMDYNISKEIYNDKRKYTIIETTHTSNFNVNDKIFLPDKFLFVSFYNVFLYNRFNVPIDVVEYPIDKKDKNINDKINSMIKLDFDPNYKHILNVGLFTPGKNQKYAFDIANELKNEKIMFHFIGNQAINFKNYWGPLMENKPDNCIIWGERYDIDDFYKSCDLFLFTSIKELNPLVIKESLEYNLPLFLFPLDTYLNKYDNNPLCNYLTNDIKTDTLLIKKKINVNNDNVKLVYLNNDIDYLIDYLSDNKINNIIKYENNNENSIYDKIIKNEFNETVDYLIILIKSTNGNTLITELNKLKTNDIDYIYNDNFIILHKKIKNKLLETKINNFNNLKEYFLSILDEPIFSDIIDISYNKNENKFYFHLKTNKKLNKKVKIFFKNKTNIIIYSTELNISNEFITWASFDINDDEIFIIINDIKNNYLHDEKIIINKQNNIDVIINVDINDIDNIDNIINELKKNTNIKLIIENIENIDLENKFKNNNIDLIQFDYIEDKMYDKYNISRLIGLYKSKKINDTNYILFINSNELINYTNLELLINDLSKYDLILFNDEDSPLLMKKNINIQFNGDRKDIFLNNTIDNKIMNIENKYKIELYKKIN